MSEGQYFWKGAWPRSRNPWKIWHTLDYVLKTNKVRDLKFGTQLHIDLPTRMEYNISERGCGLGYVTPRKFGILSTISRKLIKLEASHLVYSFILTLPTRISERGRGLGHVTQWKFGIPSTISRKLIKLETSTLVQLHIDPPHKNVVQYFWKGAWPRARDP